MILDIISWICLILGSFFCISGALGLIRFPDFYTRMHAASVTDTLGGGLIIVGMMIQAGAEWIVAVKLFLILLFLLITSPTAGHALAKAALETGLKPWKKDSDDQGGPSSNS